MNTITLSEKSTNSPDFSSGIITTELTGHDLVLTPETNLQIKCLDNWLRYRETLLKEWDMKRWIKPGYRALFHGPRGTGKTLTAIILGRQSGKDVYRVDLNQILSKYIGETEKNLSKLFEQAEKNDWILFFDEADALFGKRSEVRDAHDRYANQEVSYLLQRAEKHNGLIIFATDRKSAIDEAFIRRFQSVIYFPPPDSNSRFLLWQKVLPHHKGLQLPSKDDLESVSKKYELTGAGIVNVVQNCCLDALGGNKGEISASRLREFIELEMVKEGKAI